MNRLLRPLITIGMLFALTPFLFATSTAAQGSTFVDVTLRACPDGINPYNVDPATDCTIPIDAPEGAGAWWGGDGQGGMPLAETERLANGSYRVGVPGNRITTLFGFEPIVHDHYATVGSDGFDMSGNPLIYVPGGTTRQVSLYYYHFEQAETHPGQATLQLTLRGCPEGIDPHTISNPHAECTVPIDAPDMAGVIYGGDGQGGVELKYQSRLHDGTYTTVVPANKTVSLINFEPTVRDDYMMMGVDGADSDGDPYLVLANGETRHVHVFYYYV